MPRRRCTIINRYGLHARACAKFLAIAGEYHSRILVHKGEQTAPAESLTRLLMLAAGPGTELELEAEGEDAEAALRALENLIGNRFDEAE